MNVGKRLSDEEFEQRVRQLATDGPAAFRGRVDDETCARIRRTLREFRLSASALSRREWAPSRTAIRNHARGECSCLNDEPPLRPVGETDRTRWVVDR